MQMPEVRDRAPPATSTPESPDTFARQEGTHFIVPMLPNLLTLHPHLSVQLVRVTSVAEFYSQQVDCALLPGNLMEPTLAGRELRPGRLVVVAAPEYIERHGLPTHPSELHQHHCITLVQADGHDLPWQFTEQQAEGAAQWSSVRLRGRIRTDDIEQAMGAALACVGIAQVPFLPLQHAIAAKRLVVLMPDHDTAGISLWLVYPARRTLPKRLRAFIDFMISPPLPPSLGGRAPPRLLT